MAIPDKMLNFAPKTRKCSHHSSPTNTRRTNMELKVLKQRKSLKMRDFLIVVPNCSELFQRFYFPTQNLLSDAECKICKYKSLIISVYASNCRGQILCRGTEEGRKIYKNLQMKLPSKIKYTNICKDVFPVLCIFTFVNTDSCTFLYSLRSE